MMPSGGLSDFPLTRANATVPWYRGEITVPAVLHSSVQCSRKASNYILPLILLRHAMDARYLRSCPARAKAAAGCGRRLHLVAAVRLCVFCRMTTRAVEAVPWHQGLPDEQLHTTFSRCYAVWAAHAVAQSACMGRAWNKHLLLSRL